MCPDCILIWSPEGWQSRGTPDTSSQGSRPQPPTGICPDCSILFQKELCFDDELVLQQLRYTGMLETVRIRRSGYSAKYTFQVGCSHAHA